jgi:hypothetical protein
MNIEPGKFYKLRNGYKYRNYVTDGGGNCPNHGAYLFGDEDKWHQISHRKNGSSVSDGDSVWDIIAPWIDKPQMDTSVLPAWWKSYAMDESGSWWWHSERPTLYMIREEWLYATGALYGKIPPEYAPKWDGDWKDSLVVREMIDWL